MYRVYALRAVVYFTISYHIAFKLYAFIQFLSGVVFEVKNVIPQSWDSLRLETKV